MKRFFLLFLALVFVFVGFTNQSKDIKEITFAKQLNFDKGQILSFSNFNKLDSSEDSSDTRSQEINEEENKTAQVQKENTINNDLIKENKKDDGNNQGLTNTKDIKNNQINSSFDTQKTQQTNALAQEENTSEETSTETDEILSVYVYGSASKNFTPDKAKITAVIESVDMDMTKSKDNNYSIYNKVLSALKEAGLDESQISLDYYVCYPSYDYKAGKSLIGYYTSSTFSFNTNDTQDIKKYVDILVENGVTSIQNIRYSLSNENSAYEEVLLSAIENAKVKAEKILGKAPEKIVKIREKSVYSCNSLYRTYAQGYDNASMIGDIEIQAKVIVEFV